MQATDPNHIARRYLVEDSKAQGVPLLDRRWYYVIEVEPGIFTPGLEFDNVHLTRLALRGVDVARLECLDIGTMEAVVPILLARRGASRIVAYDRLDFHERIEFLQSKLGVTFEYLSGFTFNELPARLQPPGTPNDSSHRGSVFDLVIFSGVLYHMFDPLGGLFDARRFVRNGGIMIVETAAIISNEDHLYLNSRGRFFWGDNYWLPSLSCLDYMLRFARLKPLDCCYLPISSIGDGVCRVAVTCMAVSEAVAEDGDDWIRLPQPHDMREHISWDSLEAGARPPLRYVPQSKNLVIRSNGSLDVYASVRAQAPATVTDKQTQIWLPLDAVY